VESRAQAEEVVRYTKFPPMGDRGVILARLTTPTERKTAGGSCARRTRAVADHADQTMAGVEHVDEIVSVPGLDVALIGPYDLSTSMGIPGEVNHPRMVRAIDAFLKTASGTASCRELRDLGRGRPGVAPSRHAVPDLWGGFHAAHGAQPTGSGGAPSEGEITWPVIAERSRSCAPTPHLFPPRQELEILGKLNCEIVLAVWQIGDETIAACRDAHAVLNTAAKITRRVIANSRTSSSSAGTGSAWTRGHPAATSTGSSWPTCPISASTRSRTRP